MLTTGYCFTVAEKRENGPLLDSFEDLTHNRGQADLTVVGNVFWELRAIGPILHYSS